MSKVEYMAWYNMRLRCYDEDSKSYDDYGGRGIIVCKQWLNDFAAFFAHIGERPSSTHQLDRIDNDGNYEPGNVRWATKEEQIANRRQPDVKGQNAPNAFLTWTIVKEIRASSERTGLLALKHKVSNSCIRAIRRHETWKEGVSKC